MLNSKDTIKKVKATMEWEKHLQIKYLIGVNTPPKYKEFTQFNSKKKKKAKKMIQNWAEELNKHFPKKTHK